MHTRSASIALQWHTNTLQKYIEARTLARTRPNTSEHTQDVRLLPELLSGSQRLIEERVMAKLRQQLMRNHRAEFLFVQKINKLLLRI